MAPLLLLTRPAAQSARFAEDAVQALGPLTVVTSPLLELHFRDVAQPMDAAGVIFTSANGVRAFTRLAPGNGLRAWCVGTRTAEAAKAAGFDAVTAGADADGLVARLIEGRPAGPLLHARGVHGRGEIAERLNSAGIETKEAVLYDQRALPLSEEAGDALAGDGPILVPLFSPRTASLFAAAAAEARASLHVVALSPAVAEALGKGPWASVDVAERPDAPAMIAAMAQRLAAVRLA